MPTDQIEMLWDCPRCDTQEVGGLKDNCPTCGAAHDTKEAPWYMPGDTSHRNRITDEMELRKAHDGPNWSCPRCDGTQRNADGACLNCAGPKSEDRGPRPSFDEPVDFTPPPRDTTIFKIVGAVAAIVMLVCGLGWMLFSERPVDVMVTSVAWTQTVLVDRYKQIGDEGFDETRPSDAVDVQNLGRRVHHYDKVFDHNDTEHYTERVADGETCVTTPRSCYTTPRDCTPNDNGTATCTGGDEVCSGGDRECTTNYRNENRTREVPVYRDEARYENFYSWTVWRWKPERKIPHNGSTTDTIWADSEEICLNCRVGAGEKERESGRLGTYMVSFLYEKNANSFTHEPKNEVEFRTYPLGSTHKAMYSIVGGLDFRTANK